MILINTDRIYQIGRAGFVAKTRGQIINLTHIKLGNSTQILKQINSQARGNQGPIELEFMQEIKLQESKT